MFSHANEPEKWLNSLYWLLIPPFPHPKTVQCFRGQPDSTCTRVLHALECYKPSWSDLIIVFIFISLHCKVQMVEISSHFALIPWINRCEIFQWLFLIHLRIRDGRRGSSNVLPVFCRPFHVLYCRFCCISKFFSRLAVSLRVIILSCEWDPNRVNMHVYSLFSFDWDPKRLSPSAILVVVLLRSQKTHSASAVLVLWLWPSQIQSAYVPCRLAIGTRTDCNHLHCLACDVDPDRLILRLWVCWLPVRTDLGL
jgi:hypothetical protein